MYFFDRVHPFFVTDFAPKRDRAGLYILTPANLATPQFFIKDSDPFRNGNPFLATRAKDTMILGLR